MKKLVFINACIRGEESRTYSIAKPVDFLTKTAYTRSDFIAMAIMLGIATVCVWVMVKGRN